MSHRLKLEEVSCEIAAARTRARVQLRNAGLEHVGLASSRPEEGTWQYVIAQATINAVRMFVGFVGVEVRLALDAVSVVGDPDPVVLVSVTAGVEGQELSLLGSAMVGRDPQRAVAKAVLQALNRQIERLTPLVSGASA